MKNMMSFRLFVETFVFKLVLSFNTRTSKNGICFSSVSILNWMSEFNWLDKQRKSDNLSSSLSQSMKQSSKNLLQFAFILVVISIGYVQKVHILECNLCSRKRRFSVAYVGATFVPMAVLSICFVGTMNFSWISFDLLILGNLFKLLI